MKIRRLKDYQLPKGIEDEINLDEYKLIWSVKFPPDPNPIHGPYEVLDPSDPSIVEDLTSTFPDET